ncbi:hypothetical protein EWB00_011079 [Schistosoma japonicum]|uniref:Uncharacterized protein n=1 Tax=Schistosoma japonicum TaxID=6182 RepID=A0A4Z2DLW1_SCHJA|nr:hypothetical protein EWB00_011079 [Schistosoma japonicum]
MLFWWLINLIIMITMVPEISTLPSRSVKKYENNFEDYDNNNMAGHWEDMLPNSPINMGNEYETSNLPYFYTVPDYRRRAIANPFKTMNEDAMQQTQQTVPYSMAEMEEMDGDKLRNPSDDNSNEDQYRRLDSLEKISVY